MPASLPFSAALFDLDGTLLDSLGVWHDIDVRFFASRGMSVPEDYSRRIAGMSYAETAAYTIKNYLPNEAPDALIETWIRMAQEAYAQRVQPISGAIQYIRMLKRMGVKLVVATALPPTLYKPCLERLGIDILFDVCCSTEHVGGAGKGDGAVYLLAAERLHVPPQDCAVFEDTLAGIQGAKRAGMKGYQIRQSGVRADWPQMAALADGVIDRFDEMRAHHPFDDDPRCVIFTAWCEGDPRIAYHAEPDDMILCADGGWEIAHHAGVHPDLVIGDFDSSVQPDGLARQVHPVMKDDTDTMLCLREGLKRGYDRFLLVGGMGGRLDHTFANLQAMAFAKAHGIAIDMRDGITWCTVLQKETRIIPKGTGHLSLFALSDTCKGVTIRGAKYELEDGTLTNRFPLGVSNAFMDGDVTISVDEGMLLVMTVGEERR